jgi:hypothetical protein
LPADDAGHQTVLSGTVLPRSGPARPGAAGDAATGLVHEAPAGVQAAQAGHAPAASNGAAPPDRAGTESPAAAAPDAPGDEPPPSGGPVDSDEPELNEGLGIFGGVATTEATDDPPPRGFDWPHHRRREAQSSEPSGGTRPARVIPIGAAWNQGVTPRPVGSRADDEEKPRSFGIMRGLLRGGSADDDGHPRVSVRDLPPDVQLRLWRLRITIMVVVGAVFAALTRSWEIALTLAILAGILDTVYRSRNAGNYVINGPHPGARKATRGQLARMRREGYFALEDRPIPGSNEIIDHLVIGPSGVYAIDSEKWNPQLPIRTLNGKRLYLGPESLKDRLDHAVWEASQASEILSEALGTDIPVRAALAIYGPKVPWDIATIRNVDVFTGAGLRKYLKRRGRAKDGVVKLTREEARTIHETAARVLPTASETTSATAPVG